MSSDDPTPADFLMPPRRAHLVGICGAGMKSLAGLLLSRGWRLTGSDAAVTERQQRYFDGAGVPVHAGHDSSHVPVDCQLLVYSAAIPESNPERQVAALRGLEQISYVESLRRLMQGRVGVSVAGTHGKSSTTAMIGSILDAAQRERVVVFGAVGLSCESDIAKSRSLRQEGAPPLCVVESCEYRKHFLSLHPQVICLTGIETDHFDCYPDLASAREAYASFLAQLPGTGHCIINADDSQARVLAEISPAPVVRYSLQDASADWQATNIAPDGAEFDLQHQGTLLGRVQWSQRGRHQVANGLAAAATCGTLGIDSADIVQGLCQFPGLRRRLEDRGQCGGVQYFDDYAHHPTAVAAVLKTIRSGMTSGRLWCAFQPHQVSRTRTLIHEFSQSLSLADEVILVPVFGARESVSSEFVSTSKELTLLVRQAGVPAHFLTQLDGLQTTLETAPVQGDTVVTLGAGDIDRIYYEFTRPVQRDHEV